MDARTALATDTQPERTIIWYFSGLSLPGAGNGAIVVNLEYFFGPRSLTTPAVL
jgi:hypothetical protein